MKKLDADEVWLWHHHVENFKKLGLAKAKYCAKFGLSTVKFGNIKYALIYCKESAPQRYSKMMQIAEEFEQFEKNGEKNPPLLPFCKSRHVKKDDLYIALRHRDMTYNVLKRIAENCPPPELKEATGIPKLKPKPDKSIGEPDVDAKAAWKRIISQVSSTEDVPAIAEEKTFTELAIEEGDEEEAQNSSPPDSLIKPPMKFFALNKPEEIPKTAISDQEWSERSPPMTPFPETEIALKGNRIELTFTKTVRLTATPDTPHQKLLDIINLLKDL